MKVIFSSYAKSELDDATYYYEYELQGLGKLFRTEIRKAAKKIAVYPCAFGESLSLKQAVISWWGFNMK